MDALGLRELERMRLLLDDAEAALRTQLRRLAALEERLEPEGAQTIKPGAGSY